MIVPMEEPAPAPLVRVVVSPGGAALVAARDLPAGARILTAEGVVRATPTQTSFQLDARRHLDVPADLDADTLHREHPWRFLNHGCDPNAAFRDRVLEALRPIAAGEEIRFDYESTEDALAVPFACRCGDAGCRGRLVRGYRFLAPAEQARRRGRLRRDLRLALERVEG